MHFLGAQINKLFLIKKYSIKTLTVVQITQQMEKQALPAGPEGPKKGWMLLGVSKILLAGSSGLSIQGGSILGHLLAGSLLPKASPNAKPFMGNDFKKSITALVKNSHCICF